MEIKRKPKRFNPKIHKPRPKDHKSLKEMGDFVTERYQQIRDPEIASDPLAPVLLGGTLRLMQDELVHGAYSWWILEYCGFTPRTARRYVRKFYQHMASKAEAAEAERITDQEN
jgi:hypothetical protein